MPPISVLLVDPSLIFLRGLRGCLEDEPDIQVTGVAVCAEEAATQAEQVRPQVALADLRLKWSLAEAEPAQGNGLRLLTALSQLATPAAVLVLAANLELNWLEPLANAGARGYLAKDEHPAVLVSAVRAAAAGMSVWTPGQLALLRSHPLDCLSPREHEVLALIAQGCTNSEVGRRLGITAGAVNKHAEHIFAKFHAHNRTEAVAVARQRGLVDPPA